MKPHLAHYIDTIQVEANYYLCFPTAPEKNERKERQMMWIWVKICFCLIMNLAPKPSNIDYDFFAYLSYVARLCK